MPSAWEFWKLLKLPNQRPPRRPPRLRRLGFEAYEPRHMLTGPTISADEMHLSIDEDAETAFVDILISEPATANVSVQFSTASGTATQNVDFMAATGTLVFSPVV